MRANASLAGAFVDLRFDAGWQLEAGGDYFFRWIGHEGVPF